MRAAAAVASGKEYLSQERYLVLEAILQNGIPADLRRQVIAAQTGQDQAVAAFQVVATPSQLAFYDLHVAGINLRASTIEENSLDQLQSDRLPPGLTASEWNIRQRRAQRPAPHRRDSTSTRETVTDATTLRNNVQKQIIVDVGLLFGMVLIAMLIAWFVARSMNRSLRELKQGALNVAQNGLPQAVARLRDPALATQLSPHQIALPDRRAAAGPEPRRVRPGDRGVQRGPPGGRPYRRRAGRAAVLGRDHVRQPGPPFADPGRPADRPPGPAGARRGEPGPSGRAVPARPPGHPNAPQRRKPAGARRCRLHPRPA